MTLRALSTVVPLLLSNCFMTWAWYAHLKKAAWGIPTAIFISWLIALPEYALQVPANRLGHFRHGGPFTAPQPKVLQEAVTPVVFAGFSTRVLKEKLRGTDILTFALVFAGVGVAMIGRR